MAIFINQNYGNQEAYDFALLGLEALADGDEDVIEVDYINEIIYEIEQKCAKEIVKRVLNNSSSLSQTILGYFNQDKNYVIKYVNGILPPTSQGATSPVANCVQQTCTIEVILNNYMLQNSTDMLIAKVGLHETVHAALVYLFETGQFLNQGLDPNSNSNPLYKDLIHAYIGYLVTDNPDNLSGDLNQLQHEYMGLFVNDMVLSLKAIGLSIGYTSSSPLMQTNYLTDLVWSGSLEETDYFNQIYDNINDKQRIYHTGQAELTNSSITYQTWDFDTNGNIIQTYNNLASPNANQINNNTEPCY